MLKMKNNGIILKSYLPNKCKLVVFDKELGKVAVVPDRYDLSVGALINYHPTAQGTHYFAHRIDIIDMPFLLAQEDILFMHQVFELSYFFIPAVSYNERLFNLLLRVYMPQHLLTSSAVKKVFLFQFFSLLGLYPEAPSFQTPYFHQLASGSIDIIATQEIDLLVEKELDNWLYECMALHPAAKNFKAINLLPS